MKIVKLFNARMADIAPLLGKTEYDGSANGGCRVVECDKPEDGFDDNTAFSR